MSARASLESIVEESSGDGLDTTQAIPQALDSTRNLEHTRVILRPPSWNGKNGINSGRGMRDVCGIWCVGLFGPYIFRPQVC